MTQAGDVGAASGRVGVGCSLATAARTESDCSTETAWMHGPAGSRSPGLLVQSRVIEVVRHMASTLAALAFAASQSRTWALPRANDQWPRLQVHTLSDGPAAAAA